jgi:hypothetical protein
LDCTPAACCLAGSRTHQAQAQAQPRSPARSSSSRPRQCFDTSHFFFKKVIEIATLRQGMCHDKGSRIRSETTEIRQNSSISGGSETRFELQNSNIPGIKLRNSTKIYRISPISVGAKKISQSNPRTLVMTRHDASMRVFFTPVGVQYGHHLKHAFRHLCGGAASRPLGRRGEETIGTV